MISFAFHGLWRRLTLGFGNSMVKWKLENVWYQENKKQRTHRKNVYE
jgi:hypothetical protein